MKHITGLLVFISLTFFLTGLSHAAHPLVTDDTGTQGKGQFQLELNTEYGHDKEDGIKTETVENKIRVENVIKVRRVDMLDGTPVIDIKPYIEYTPYGG